MVRLGLFRPAPVPDAMTGGSLDVSSWACASWKTGYLGNSMAEKIQVGDWVYVAKGIVKLITAIDGRNVQLRGWGVTSNVIPIRKSEMDNLRHDRDDLTSAIEWMEKRNEQA